MENAGNHAGHTSNSSINSTGTCKIKAQFYKKNIFLPPLPFFVFFRYFLTFMDKPGRPAPQFELSKKLFSSAAFGKEPLFHFVRFRADFTFKILPGKNLDIRL